MVFRIDPLIAARQSFRQLPADAQCKINQVEPEAEATNVETMTVSENRGEICPTDVWLEDFSKLGLLSSSLYFIAPLSNVQIRDSNMN